MAALPCRLLPLAEGHCEYAVLSHVPAHFVLCHMVLPCTLSHISHRT